MTVTFYCCCFLSADTDQGDDENGEVGRLQAGWRKEPQQGHASVQLGGVKVASVLGTGAADGPSQSRAEVLWPRAKWPRREGAKPCGKQGNEAGR